MPRFDKLFRKNRLDRAIEHAYEEARDNNPITRKVKATIDESADEITRSLERELRKKGIAREKDRPSSAEGRPSVVDDFEAVSADWDHMIDQIMEHELGKYKICPNCCEAVPAEKEKCPHCGSPLPENTAAYQICPNCGEINRALDLHCVKCGEKLELVPQTGVDDET